MKKQIGKRLFSLFFAALFIISCMVFDLNASTEVMNYRLELPKAVASPCLDGVIEADEWTNSLEIPLKESEMKYLLSGMPEIGEDSYALAMWDEDYLYFAFEIFDSTADDEDGPDILLFSGVTAEDNGPSVNLRLEADGYLSAFESQKQYLGINTSNVRGANVRTDEKYVIETAISWTLFDDMYAKEALGVKYEPKAGTEILFDIMLHDSDSRCGRLSTVENVWACGENASLFTLTDSPAGIEKDTSKGPYAVPRIGISPEIDGFIDPDEWQNSCVFSLGESALTFDTLLEGKIGEDSYGFIAWNESGLYIGAEIYDETPNLGDGIALEIYPNLNPDYKEPSVISLNKNRALISGLESEDIICKSDEYDGMYSLEAFIPIEVFEDVKTGFEDICEYSFEAMGELYMNVVLCDMTDSGIRQGSTSDGENGRDLYCLRYAAAGIPVPIPDYNQHLIPKAKYPIILDGVIEEGEWTGAFKDEMSKANGTPVILQGYDPDHDCVIYLNAMWDDDYLYYAFDVYDETPNPGDDYFRFDFFGTSIDARNETDHMLAHIAPWTKIKNSPDIALDNMLLLKISDYTEAALKKLGTGHYSIEIRMSWSMFEDGSKIRRETAGRTYYYTGNYSGRAGTVIPCMVSYVDRFCSDGYDSTWFLYYNGKDKSKAWKSFTNAPNDIDTWKLSGEYAIGQTEPTGKVEDEILEIPENRYEIPRAANMIVPDGVIGDEWKNAQVLDLSVINTDRVATVMNNNKESLGNSRVLLLWDDTYLYVAYDIKDATDTGFYAQRGGASAGPVDTARINFFSDESSTFNHDALDFTFVAKTADYKYKKDNHSGGFENNINAAFYTYKNLPTDAVIADDGSYNFQMEICIPFSLFADLNKLGQTAFTTFVNYPTPEAGVTFKACFQYMDADSEGNTSWVYHNHFANILPTFPFSYNTMDEFVLGPSTEIHKHTLQKQEAKSPSCTEDGNIEHYICTDENCKMIFEDENAEKRLFLADVIIKKTGHDYQMSKNETAHFEQCGNCGDIINLGEHIFGNWEIVKDPEIGSDGQKERTCSECGYVDIQAIPELDTPRIIIDSAEGILGEEIVTYVHLLNNPGIVSMRFEIVYDSEKLELVSVEDLGALKGWTDPVEIIKSPYRVRWSDSTTETNNITKDNILKLTFKAADGTAPGDYTVKIVPVQSFATVDKIHGMEIKWWGSEADLRIINPHYHEYLPGHDEEKHYEVCECGDIINVGQHQYGEWETVKEAEYQVDGLRKRVCSVCKYEQNEIIPQLEFLYGDINGDGHINETDSVLLARYLAGWNVKIDINAANVNADENGTVDESDFVILARYLAGWNVPLGPKKQQY